MTHGNAKKKTLALKIICFRHSLIGIMIHSDCSHFIIDCGRNNNGFSLPSFSIVSESYMHSPTFSECQLSVVCPPINIRVISIFKWQLHPAITGIKINKHHIIRTDVSL